MARASVRYLSRGNINAGLEVNGRSSSIALDGVPPLSFTIDRMLHSTREQAGGRDVGNT